MRDTLLTERCVDDLDLVQHVAYLLADASEILFAEVLLLNALILLRPLLRFLRESSLMRAMSSFVIISCYPSFASYESLIFIIMKTQTSQVKIPCTP